MLTRPSGAPLRVLVAEDDHEMRRLVVEALRADGYEVSAVPDGGRLLVTLAHRIVDREGEAVADLIVADIRMPICTGLQILEQLRASHRWVPFILMTAFGDARTRAHASQLGATLLDKPFAVAELRAAVAALLPRGAG